MAEQKLTRTLHVDELGTDTRYRANGGAFVPAARQNVTAEGNDCKLEILLPGDWPITLNTRVTVDVTVHLDPQEGST